MDYQEKINKDKLLGSLSVLVKANSYRNDPQKFSNFVLKNSSYFPFIDKDKLKKISKDNDEVLVFKQYELYNNTKK